MRPIRLLLCLSAVVCALAAFAAPQADFYVAVSGRDTWSGRLAAPNAARTDGPFASLPRAQQAVRNLKAAHPDRAGAITVMVRGGTYFLADTLTFLPEDSGTAACPIVYAAYPGEIPILSGGTRLTGWTKAANDRWQTTIPQVRDGKWSFTQLFVAGERRYRPRWPKAGFSYATAPMSPSKEAEGKGYDRFHYRAGDVRADWANLRDVELLTFHTWTMDRTAIAAADEQTRVVQRSAPTLGAIWFFNLDKGTRFICENVKEALGDLGQWYLDRPTGVLTYVPQKGEDPTKTEIIAPRLQRLVKFTGQGPLGLWVDNVTFRGLTFAHSNWAMTPAGNRHGQAEVDLGCAVSLAGARNCALESCKVTHVGEYGVGLGPGAQDCRLENCEITDMAAGGVKIGDWASQPDDGSLSTRNTVTNCLIAHGGRMHPAGIGVWVGRSPGNTISHNEICDLYYSGLSLGWTWGYGESKAHDNTVEFNDVHDIGQGVLSDMGGIYTLGPSPGTVIRNNCFHDVFDFLYGGWGIYLDEGSSGILIENNITYNTHSPGFRQHYGKENIARNNIIALATQAQVGRLRLEPHLSYTFEHNIVYWTEGTLLGESWTDNNFKFDYNLYWNPDPKAINFAGLSLADWQKKGQDEQSLVADPLFVAPEKGDFRLKPGSPAEKLGFKPIDRAQIGRLLAPGAKRTETPAAQPRAFPIPVPPPPMPIDADFEDQAMGEKAAGAVTNEENEQATIRITDEVAAPGADGKPSRHSLKFIDMPGQKAEYNPHLWYEPNFAVGVIEEKLDLRVEQGTHMYHEWRDYGTAPYAVGPSLWVSADGACVVNGTKLFDVPWGKWVHIEITCGVGFARTGKYDLRVTLPGDARPREWKDIAFATGFKVLNHIIFTANANAAGTFYVDNLHLAPRAGGK